MTDHTDEERPVPCSVQLRELSSQLADVERDNDHLRAEMSYKDAQAQRVATCLQSVVRVTEFKLPSDILKDIHEINGGGE